MIPSQEHKFAKKLPLKDKDYTSELIEKAAQIPITKMNLDVIRDLHPALNNTYICVQVTANNAKRVLHLTSDGKILGELPIKEAEYQLFMLSPRFANLIEYTDKKPQAHNVQWNLQTYQNICVNLNREIMPMLKIFAFSQSSTFCVCQYDHHIENATTVHKEQEPGTYHTKFKLSYYKHPLHKAHQKPFIVFKTHTNPKEYGHHQEIIKLNNHSMVGSISNKMDENDETLLKTFDFRNVPMGIEINYKFHVHINYRKELLRLWVTDMWEIRPEHFYLKCELRVDKAKEEKLWKLKSKVIGQENVQQCLHLTWAYKNENTIKFAKFKTPLLNSIQFLDGFKQKERVRTLFQKVVSKEKVQYATSTSHLTLPVCPPNYVVAPHSQQQTSQSTYPQPQIINLSGNQSALQIGPKVETPVLPVTTYTKSLHILPVYYVNNATQEIVVVDREFGDWMAAYPAYYPTMVVYFRQVANKDGDKCIEVACQKKKQSYTVKDLQVFLLDEIINELDPDLCARVATLADGSGQKMKDLDNDWHCVENSKIYRQKSKSNYESREYKV